MSSVKENIEVIFKEIPEGLPGISNFEVRKSSIDLERVDLKPSAEFLVRPLYISLDTFLLNFMRKPEEALCDVPPFLVGEPMRGWAVSEVVKSNNPDYAVGEVVLGWSNWANYSVVNPATAIFSRYKKIPNPKSCPFPLSYFLGLMGEMGLCAYIGLHKTCEPLTAGQTLYVSAAAGGIGHIVGQYGKSLGLRVVGCAGTDDKVKSLTTELGFDAAFNYKAHEADYGPILKETCPKGIDIYFDNVGGKMLDAVLLRCNDSARIVLCGLSVSQYARQGKSEPVTNLLHAINFRVKMEGLMGIMDFEKYEHEGLKALEKVVAEGKLKYKEHVTEGVENIPEAFVRVLHGSNFGKSVVHVADL